MLIECIDTADIRKQYFNCTDLKTLFNSVAGDTILAYLSEINLIRQRTYNDKAYTSPHLFGQFFNFRTFIKFFIHEVKKTSKFKGSGLYLHNKYQ